MTTDDLMALFADPTAAARRAHARRQGLRGDRVAVLGAPEHPRPDTAALLRRGDVSPCEAWPAASALQDGDRLVVVVPASAAGRRRFAEYVLSLGTAPPCSMAPVSGEPAGLHSLWCVAAARLALPAQVRVEARHDFLGTHLAQLALGFGADVLSGPIADSRHLPLAGTTRPTERSREGLFTLVEQVGLHPEAP